MSWGIKIICLYTGFVGLILTMVFMAVGENVDLVSDDYYQQELEYQEKLNTMNRTSELAEALHWELDAGELLLAFPGCFSDSLKSASICFFRPSDARFDRTVVLPESADSIRKVSLSNLTRGVYKMQINWQVGATAYYNEGIIQLP